MLRGLNCGGEMGNRRCEVTMISKPGTAPAVPISISDFPCPASKILSRFSRILASYFRRFFRAIHRCSHSFSTCLRDLMPCDHTHLAQSPQSSTCPINMHDNNLRGESLLRAESGASTLRSPRSTRSVVEPFEITAAAAFPCISSPAHAPLDRSSARRGHPCARTRRRSVGRATGACATNGITRAASHRTAATGGFAWRMTTSP